MKQKIKGPRKTKIIQTKLPLKSAHRHYSFGFLVGSDYN